MSMYYKSVYLQHGTMPVSGQGDINVYLYIYIYIQYFNFPIIIIIHIYNYTLYVILSFNETKK